MENLRKTYYDPTAPGAFGGLDKLHRAIKNIKKDYVKDWLTGERTYTLHKPYRKRFKRNRIMADGVDHIWGADLADMSKYANENDGYRYILVTIDVVSKFVNAVPIKRKTTEQMISAFEKIFDKGRIPTKIHTDLGLEFVSHKMSAFFKEYDVITYSTFNFSIKSSVAERALKTLKNIMHKMFTYTGNHRYVENLPKIVSAYNDNYHSSIKMTPNEASKPKNAKKVYGNLYPPQQPIKASDLEVNDHVRILRTMQTFDKGYEKKWTEEIFTIYRVYPTPIIVYGLKDLNGEKIVGKFYRQEVQKVKKPETYRIREVIKTRKRRGNPKEYLVSFIGYPSPQFDQWVTDLYEDGSPS